MEIQTPWRWLKDLQVKKLMSVDIDNFHVRLKVSHEREADLVLSVKINFSKASNAVKGMVGLDHQVQNDLQ